MNTIKCPECDYEYLPGEIFIPNQFVGQPKQIERDYSGKIIYNEGIDQNLEEEFICEKCGTKFKIKASIDYNINIIKPKVDMETEHITQLYEDRIKLKED